MTDTGRGIKMKTSVSKEDFIHQFEIYLNVMDRFVSENEIDAFYSTQSSFSTLLSFAFINSLLSEEEHQYYSSFDHCFMDGFKKLERKG